MTSTSPYTSWSGTEQDTINDLLRRAVNDNPERPFLDFLGKIYSVSDIDREACQLANGLKAQGISKGNTVATLLDNSAEAIFIWLAINKLGAVSVPINTAYKGEYLRHQLSDSAATIVIAESDYAERTAEIADGLSEIKTLVYRGDKPNLTDFKHQLLSWDELHSTNTSDPMIEVSPGDLSMLIYTGGTTGPSKGCMVSHNYACNLAQLISEGTGRSKDTVSWTALPLFHLNAVVNVLCDLKAGGRMALYPRFSVSNFWPEIERTGANYTTLLGSMFPMLLTAPENDAEKRCRGQLAIVGGAPFPTKLQEAWKERFGAKHTVCPGFGLTECSLVTSLPLEAETKPDCSGKRNSSFDVRIIDDNGNEVPDGQSGEVIVRPLKPHVMFNGYWKRPEDTLKVMDNMWFHTGDIGKFDEDGFFYFVDRKKDYLRRRGENISSFEVESSFRRHPAIEDIAAHAVLSDMTEDDLKVTIVLRQGETITEEDLCRWSADQMPYFAVPRYIEFRTELPRNPVGRVLKYKLRDEGVTSTTWDREVADIKIQKR
ncbi:ATP-dependent acyl-CoA ligase [Aestuariicella hydrocarbonica]|uniref:ATP-dependent acyl-CoA ligase n=1 Tax=Pseudomaricurvus hydrocarbonicus TaxID=1470433 RepID=A0A9E5JU83_9GAMM|nr:AMP-binding protein [Aestuariicella hydrocarbonica]NHO66644.1 ATP-dependent acyl-CoA ligase [Aestuariicella hydrocarbonica]